MVRAVLDRFERLPFDPGTKVVDVYARYLRLKIDEGEETPLIQTVRGAGYGVGVRDD
jgi:DNA-binding response OmpR family regulator